MALSSLSAVDVSVTLVEVSTSCRFLSPPRLSLSWRDFVGMVGGDPSWLGGPGGGLLVGVEVPAVPGVSSSESLDMSDSTARIPNLLPVFHVLPLGWLPATSPVSMIWLGPKKIKWGL